LDDVAAGPVVLEQGRSALPPRQDCSILHIESVPLVQLTRQTALTSTSMVSLADR